MDRIYNSPALKVRVLTVMLSHGASNMTVIKQLQIRKECQCSRSSNQGRKHHGNHWRKKGPNSANAISSVGKL